MIGFSAPLALASATTVGEEYRAAGWLAPSGRVTSLPCSAREDLAHQTALTNLLFRVRPVYEARTPTAVASLLEVAGGSVRWLPDCFACRVSSRHRKTPAQDRGEMGENSSSGLALA
ncbi:hypothetical protein [Candidatus Accumulibacter contiguus]|jgi:hypothetical protein|uniref:hypothetical protein n=1 Tax=Candidatus Accumulibacter contiguus TaxID=2954381 RepID=UPI00145DB030|nr:hypothetical protein [Candidatus Accumulibacter contiguus]